MENMIMYFSVYPTSHFGPSAAFQQIFPQNSVSAFVYVCARLCVVAKGLNRTDNLSAYGCW